MSFLLYRNCRGGKVSKVGIITYHAAYNYGSVLQAKATQDVIKNLGNDAVMINYRPQTQVEYYEKLYRTAFGIKPFIKDLTMLPAAKPRKKRAERFEHFINTEFNLTPHRYSKPEQLDELADAFDVTVSGSDQLFNKHSNELQSEPWSAMDPYLLTFVKKGKRISYASSLASMNREETYSIADKLHQFDHLSAREKDAAELLSEIVGYEVPNVLDPTLLLNGEQWHDLAKIVDNELPERYVVYYSLDGTNKMSKRLSSLKKLAERADAQVLAITPFAILPYSKQVISGHDIGPLEFISAIEHALLVVTDSYHGTLFSVNMNTPFWSISSGKASSTRKDQALERLFLADHVAPSLENIVEKDSLILEPPLSEQTRNALDDARAYSMKYLKSAINA